MLLLVEERVSVGLGTRIVVRYLGRKSHLRRIWALEIGRKDQGLQNYSQNCTQFLHGRILGRTWALTEGAIALWIKFASYSSSAFDKRQLTVFVQCVQSFPAYGNTCWLNCLARALDTDYIS